MGLENLDKKTIKLIVGRLALWSSTFRHCRELLKLHDRASVAYEEDESLKEECDNFFNGQQAKVCELGLEGKREASQVRKLYELENPRPFPHLWEVFQIKSATIELAIVYFYQIFTDYGPDESEESVAGSNDMGRILQDLERRAFPDRPDKKEYNKFKKQIMEIRNNMLGHANGEYYKVDHKDDVPDVMAIPMPGLSGRKIDEKYWIKVIDLLQSSLHEIESEYQRKLKSLG